MRVAVRVRERGVKSKVRGRPRATGGGGGEGHGQHSIPRNTYLSGASGRPGANAVKVLKNMAKTIGMTRVWL